jgi:outer membrane protein
MMVRTTLFTLLMTLASWHAAAGESLTAAAAVAAALENNPLVGAALAEAQASEARADQARGFRLPRVDLSEAFSYTDNPAEVFAMTLNQGRFDMEAFFLGNPNTPDPLDTWMTRLDLELPIYTGGKLSARIRQSNLAATAQQLQYERTREQVTFDTLSAFTNLAKAREHLDLLRSARNTTAEHLRLAEHFAEQGLILRAEVLKASVHLAELDEKVSQASNQGRLAEAALSFHMGADQTTSHTLAPLPPFPPVAGDVEQWIETALAQRPDLEAARRQTEAGELEEQVARSGFLPEVAVVGHYGLYDDTPFGSNGHSGSIMAVARINLFRGGSDGAAVAAARHQNDANEANIRRFEEGVRLEVLQAWQDLETARVRQHTASTSVDAAREELRIREQRFRQGLDKMIDLLGAQTSLTEAEVRELVARFDAVLAGLRLHLAAGAPLTRDFIPTDSLEAE